MNTKTILVASIAALTIGGGAPSLAATPAQNQPGGPNMMRPGAGPGPNSPMMGGGSAELRGSTNGEAVVRRGDSDDDDGMPYYSMMRRGGMMGSGMVGMMGGGVAGRGMMGGYGAAMDAGLDRKDAMRMRGEMMRAVGDILIKYADKVQEPAAKP